MFTCPVCYYGNLRYPPMNYNICECCGTEFGLHDDDWTHEELRAGWLQQGCPWFFGEPPLGWNASVQLYEGLVIVPAYIADASFSGSAGWSISEQPDHDDCFAQAS